MARATQKQVREAAATVRQNLREAVEWHATGNYLNAYAAAERAQFAAFDFKELMGEMGHHRALAAEQAGLTPRKPGDNHE